jgi:hypothetical protein
MLLREFIRTVVNEARPRPVPVKTVVRMLQSLNTTPIKTETQGSYVVPDTIDPTDKNWRTKRAQGDHRIASARFVAITFAHADENVDAILAEIEDRLYKMGYHVHTNTQEPIYKNHPVLRRYGKPNISFDYHDEPKDKVLFYKITLKLTSFYDMEQKSENKYSGTENDPKHLIYHITDRSNLASIQKKGLTPRASTGITNPTKYPARIYFMPLLKKVKVQLSSDMKRRESGKPTITDTDDPIILLVDTSKLRRGTKFYQDPEMPGGVWTYSHIPPEAIVDVMESGAIPDLRTDHQIRQEKEIADFKRRLAQYNADEAAKESEQLV